MRLFGPNGEPEPVSDTSPAILIGPVWPKPAVVMTNGAATAPALVSSALRRVIRRDGMAAPLCFLNDSSDQPPRNAWRTSASAATAAAAPSRALQPSTSR